jgi:predicted DNA-binding transcriptional regulator YafY
MNRTDRLYAIVEELRANGRRGRTAAWLARRFEVSSRTIKRDIAALQSAGTPITGQDGRGGGYQLSADVLQPVTLTSAEVGALAIALGADRELPFAPDGRTALTKLLRTCARTIDESVRRGVGVTIDYEDGVGRLTRRRRIDPLAIARTGGRWYVLAWCHTRRAGRWFRFDRIRRASLTRTPVPPRDLSQVFGEPPADAQPIAYRLR